MAVGPGMDMPIMHDSDRYELLRDIGSGNFGVARLMRDKHTEELVAVKYIERGEKVCHLPSLSFFCYLYRKSINQLTNKKLVYRNQPLLNDMCCMWGWKFGTEFFVGFMLSVF